MVETIIFNANILTIDPVSPKAQAAALSRGRFIAVGTNDEVLALRQAGTTVIDLQGQMVVPGFNDSHMHFMGIGAAKERVDLGAARSRRQLIEMGRAFLRDNPGLTWLLGRGWNHDRFDDQQMPTRHDLDQISTDLPILFTRVCGHVSVANSKALELAGLGQGLEQPRGGHVDLDEQGCPTGVLRERASGLVGHLIPKDTLGDYKRMLQKSVQEALRLGLTSVQTDDLGDNMALKLQAFQELVADGELPLRVNLQIRLAKPEQLMQYTAIKQRFAFPTHTVEYGPIKLMCDGSLGGRTAALNEPYSDDPTTCGVAVLDQDEINTMYCLAHQQGFQVSGHAIGDKAMDQMLNGFRKMLTEKPMDDARPRIIHAQITTPSILAQCQELGVVCDIQPTFVGTDLHIVEKRVGKDRMKSTYAWKAMREMGIPTAGGSDSPVESCSPLLGIYSAVTRQDTNGFPAGGWLPGQKLTVHEAIELFTMGSAYACFDEHVKGSITAGKLADFVVLGEDLTTIELKKIKDVPVIATYIGGRKVYEA